MTEPTPSPEPRPAPPLVYYGKRPPPPRHAPAPPLPPSKDGKQITVILLCALGALVVAAGIVGVIAAKTRGGGSTTGAASADVRISSCSQSSNQYDFLGPAAKVEITNHTQRSHSYWVTVEFVSGSTRIGTGSAHISDLAPGMTQTVDATSWQNDNKLSSFTCTITKVSRI